jgi:uncharacterized protein (TIGR00299 family) protein
LQKDHDVRIAYFDCASGISGDMTVAALLDLGVEFELIQRGIDSLRLPGVRLHLTEVQRCGFRAKHFRVEHPEQHAHRHLSDIIQLLDRSDALSDTQRKIALKIFQHVAEAEAKVHGSTVEQVHFHEVGAIDSIVDIVAVAIALDVLDVDEIVCSSVPTGRGTVHIAHGECAVPTPGTLELLQGMPLVDVAIDAELTTPTGAAILKTVVDRFVPGWPGMMVEVVGCGAGTKDFKTRANILRIAVGEDAADPQSDEVLLLETNLDDASPEVIGYTKRKLLASGALDVYSTPIQMKKDRPGVILSVICRPEDAEDMEDILFDETPTLGIRRQTVRRTLRQRTKFTVDTQWGPVEGKLGWREGEAAVFKPEYEDCSRIAEAYDVPLREVYLTAQAEFLLSADDVDPHEHDHDGDECDHEHDHDEACEHDHDEGHSHDHDHDHRHDHD